MQGSRLDDQIEGQDYRLAITRALEAHVPGVRVTDPWASNPDSVTYDEDMARQTFMANTARAAEADVVIAYLPHASMGTAIEMWTAYQAKKPIIAVTPLRHNWVVLLTAREILPDLDSLLEYIRSGRFARVFAPPKADSKVK